MKPQKSNPIVLTLVWLILSTLSLQLSTAFVQGTAFSYQGRLNNNGTPANGSYDFRFKLYSDPLGNTQVGASYLTNAISVTTGLFATTIDFGAGLFTGRNYWLEVDVKTNNTGSYTVLSPLQAVTPTPYAIMANTASNLLGTLPAAQLTAGTANISITGSAASATTATNFSGSLSGQVTGPQNNTVVAGVGGQSAANVASGAAAANAATSGDIGNTIVKRDTLGDFTNHNISLDGSLYLPSQPVIYAGGIPFIYAEDGSGSLFAGFAGSSLRPAGTYNTAFGDNIMCDDMNSFGNTAIGYSALSQNKIAGENTAVGFRALSANDNDGKFQANDNTGIGSHALAKT